jgi:hypothetical protein
MAKVTFASSIPRHVAVAPAQVNGKTVREVLEAVFTAESRLRNYLLDDQGALRHHVNVFVDGKQVTDRDGLSDVVAANAQVHVIQALSGG